MDIQGYDEWRLQVPDDFYQEMDIEEMTEAAGEMAIDMLTDDSDRVEYLMAQDESWLGLALSVATGVLNSEQLKVRIVDMVITHLVEDCYDEVQEFIELNQGDTF